MSGLSFKVDRPGNALSFSSRGPQRAQRRALDSDDEDDAPKDELLSGFGAKGSIRLVPSAPASGPSQPISEQVVLSRKDRTDPRPDRDEPLVIPSMPNTDWRALAQARRQRAAIYLPEGARIDGRAETPVLAGPDAHRDIIGAKPVVGGLKLATPAAMSSPALSSALADASLNTPSDVGALTPANAPSPSAAPVVETEDQKALRELLSGQTNGDEAPRELDAIAVAPDGRVRPPTEDDAFRMDIETRPDTSTAEDYARVPIEQFGAALLRGMGWQKSEAQEAHVPSRRPALLGLGAKESSLGVEEKRKDGRPAPKKPEQRFMPLIRQDSRSLPPSRDRSRSPTSREASEDERRRRERRSDRDRDYDSERDRKKSSSSRRDDRDRDERTSSRREGESSKRRDDRDDYSSSRRERDRDDRDGRSSRYKEDDRERRRDRDRDSDRNGR